MLPDRGARPCSRWSSGAARAHAGRTGAARVSRRSAAEHHRAAFASTAADSGRGWHALQAQAQARWQDPAYVEAQARERLHYVLPGETRYVVLGPDEAPARRTTGDEPTGPGTPSSARSGGDGDPARLDGEPVGRPRVAPGAHGRYVDRPPAPAELATGRSRPRPPSRGSSAATPRGVRARRAPLPVRPARRRRDLAAAAGRHAVPDAVLPDLPAGRRRRSARWRPTGMMREMTERLAADPELAAAYRARARGLPGARATRSRTCRRSPASSAGGMPDRVKCLHVLVAHALAAGPGVQPARRRGARRAAASGGAAGPCVARTPSRRRDAGRGDRLRHQLDPAAGRRRRRRAGALTDLDRRMEIVRLGQGVDRTGRLAPEALERTFAACREYAAAIARARRRARCGSSRPPPPATPTNRDEFVAGVRRPARRRARGRHRRRGGALSFAGATRELRRPATSRAVPGRRHRRRLDRVRARRRRAGRSRRRGRSTSAACG